jgi:hypothetical protein
MALAGFGAVVIAGGPALAHHSFAVFDLQKTTTLEGAVREFQWTNPHCWVLLIVKDAAGNTIEWPVEAGSPNALARSGWKRDSLKPGDKAVLTIHPFKDGASGGSMVAAFLGGRRIGAAPRVLSAPCRPGWR